jgi:hypothetical protein
MACCQAFPSLIPWPMAADLTVPALEDNALSVRPPVRMSGGAIRTRPGDLWQAAGALNGLRFLPLKGAGVQ